MWPEDWQQISKVKTVRQQVLHEWNTILKPRVLLARKNRGILGHVHPDDLDDYVKRLAAAQTKTDTCVVPSMYLAQESINTITDLATRLSIHEDVLRAYMGIDDDDKEQHYICALQSDSAARTLVPAEYSCLGDAVDESNCVARTSVPANECQHESEINLIQRLQETTGWFEMEDVNYVPPPNIASRKDLDGS